MGILTILEFPDERLRKKAAAVKTVDDAIRKLVDEMLETTKEFSTISRTCNRFLNNKPESDKYKTDRK